MYRNVHINKTLRRADLFQLTQAGAETCFRSVVFFIYACRRDHAGGNSVAIYAIVSLMS